MFDWENAIALHPMQGNWASSTDDLGYMSFLCSYDELRVSLGLLQCSPRLSGVPSRKSRLCSCLMGNTELLCMQCSGIGPHLGARGKSYVVSRVGVGTSCIFLSSTGNGPSKLVFPQQHQDSCLVVRDTSGFWRLARKSALILR